MATTPSPPITQFSVPNLYTDANTSTQRVDILNPLYLLPKCNSLRELKQIQAFTIKTHLQNDLNVLTKFINFCTHDPTTSSMDHARLLFDKIPEPDIVFFNTMARGYSRSKTPIHAVSLFVQVLNSGLLPDDYTFPCLLKACACISVKGLEEGKQLHCFAIKLGLNNNVYVRPTLINMYFECNDVDAARRVFDKISEPCVVSYNAIITGYARRSRPNEALSLFRELQERNLKPTDVTMLSALSSCALLGSLELGKWIHEYIKKYRFDKYLKVSTALIDMYAKCGSLDDAVSIFDNMRVRDTQACYQDKNLISRMQTSWPTLACSSGHGSKFWSHEWDKHGTCSESVLDQLAYFEAGLNLKDKIDLLQILKNSVARISVWHKAKPTYCKPHNHFKRSKMTGLNSRMQVSWPSLACPSGNGVKLWSNEWEKYGTCSRSKQHEYFEAALKLKDKIDLLQILKKSGIKPDGKFYSLFKIKNSLRGALGYEPGVYCNDDKSGKNNQLYQIFICFDPSGTKVIECPGPAPSAARGLNVINFRSPNLYPEGLAWDSSAQHFIVGSLFHRSLHSVSDAGVAQTLISDPDLPVNVTVLGLAVDRTNNRILAVVQSLRHLPPFSALAAYDLRTRQRVFLALLLDDKEGESAAAKPTTTTTRHAANDVAVDFRGNAYVTNSAANFIWKVDKDGAASVFSRSPAFTAHPLAVDPDAQFSECGLNGIAYVSKGYLLVVQSNTGKMFKVNAEDGKARLVLLTEDLVWADDIAIRKDGVVLVASTHTLWFLKSEDSWGEAVVYDKTALEEEKFATSVVVGDDDRAYVLNGHVIEGIMGNVGREEFSIEEIKSSKESENDNIWLFVLIGLGLAYVLFWRFQMKRLVKNMDKKIS
ncbi:hypothetical protein Q3G72_027587 [Acer saccharum]|nr:hypothetical protein Q3G72_027587 [Acer saccharum]